MAVVNFEVTGDYSSFAPGQIISADVLFTPIFVPGEMATATDLVPPLGFIPTPIKAKIKAGSLVGLDTDTVELIANSGLNLAGPLFYRVTYVNFTATTMHATLAGIVTDSQQVQVNSFEFEAPLDDTPIDLITVTPAPGATRATGIITIPASGISDANHFTRGFLTTVTDQASALIYLGAGSGGGGGGTGLEWEQFDTETDFPVPGDALKEYVAKDTGRIYRWDGAEYVTWIPTKADVLLSDVDNTSDAAKNVAVAILKNKDLTDSSNTFPVFNQDTTGNAATATLAATATAAVHATSADSATNAGHATTADSATIATSAALASAATKLATAHTINGVPFDGTADIIVAGGGDGGGGEPPITAGTTLQYWRGDKTFQTLNQDVVPSGTTNHVFTAAADARLANTSGTNTGDQTSVSGNAGTATKLATARTINGVSFDGTGNITVVDATKEPAITAGTTLQVWRGDKTFVTLNQDIVPDGTTNKAFTATIATRLANTSGTNTGDQVNITGNAATATHATTADSATTATSASLAGRLSSAHLINGVAFDGSADITIVDSTKLTQTQVDARVAVGTAALVASAPSNLDTLNELATALGDDPNFATTMTTLIGTKVGSNGTVVNAVVITAAAYAALGSGRPSTTFYIIAG